jgi:hypothetical protein
MNRFAIQRPNRIALRWPWAAGLRSVLHSAKLLSHPPSQGWLSNFGMSLLIFLNSLIIFDTVHIYGCIDASLDWMTT